MAGRDRESRPKIRSSGSRVAAPRPGRTERHRRQQRLAKSLACHCVHSSSRSNALEAVGARTHNSVDVLTHGVTEFRL